MADNPLVDLCHETHLRDAVASGAEGNGKISFRDLAERGCL